MTCQAYRGVSTILLTHGSSLHLFGMTWVFQQDVSFSELGRMSKALLFSLSCECVTSQADYQREQREPPSSVRHADHAPY